MRALFLFTFFQMRTSKNDAGTILPTEYTFNGSQVRTVVIDSEPYFVATDVCYCLSISNPTVAMKTIDEDERSKYYLGRQGHTWIVNESGLYHLIFQSRKPEAKTFRKWVTSEVLPELRKRGSFTTLPDVAYAIINDRKMYPFHEMALKLGYISGGSLYDKRLRYPGQFLKLGQKYYASEDMCRLMALNRRTNEMRRSVAKMQPVIGAAETLPRLF